MSTVAVTRILILMIACMLTANASAFGAPYRPEVRSMRKARPNLGERRITLPYEHVIRFSSASTDYIGLDTTPPLVTVRTPYQSSMVVQGGEPYINLSGDVSDDTVVQRVYWSSNQGYESECAGASDWSASAIPLAPGENLITVAAVDAAHNIGADSILILYQPDFPTVEFTNPASYEISVTSSRLDIAGTAVGEADVASAAWYTDKGFSGSCSGTSNWQATGIPLVPGINIVTVRATDTRGFWGESSLVVTAVDTVAPMVAVTSPTPELAHLRVGSTVKIQATAQDNFTVAEVTWSDEWGNSGVCNGTGDAWVSGNIPLYTGDNVITVTATDRSGNQNSESITVTRLNASPAGAWEGMAMVSLPIIPDSSDPKAVTGFTSNKWWSYSPSRLLYSGYPDAYARFDPRGETPGRGFWATFGEYTAEPQGYALPQDEEVPIHLLPGWNLIGQPYVTPVEWDRQRIKVRRQDSGEVVAMADAGDVLAGYAWGWQQNAENPMTGSYYLVSDIVTSGSGTNQMYPWRAFWIRVYKECDLILPPPGYRPSQ